MNLVEIKNGQPTTSSLKVAEVFEIEHKHVLRDIRDLKEDVVKNLESPNLDSVDLSMFQEDFYEVSNNNRKYPMFNMNKDGFVLLVMGYTTKRATQFKLQYIAQFNKMEKFIKQQTQPSLPQDYATALEQLAKQVRLNESLQIKVEQLSQPTLVEQTELLPNVLYSTEEIAQEIGYSSARALNQRMYAERVVYYSKKDRSWLLYAPYKDRGLKDLSTRRKSQLWTEKGREFIKVRFTENK
ncbi:Rha family transcriptional regulator [Vagococcus fluvialis]|uniref:Rha family transcriptional regulator n=1 Tax=Vagococcus fluvialis TaxID=2738 RepID=UPI0037899736